MSGVLANPYGISPAMDYNQSPPRLDVPLWSENYIFQGSDPEKGIFFYHLIGRMAGNPHYWRSVFQCTLPSGDLLSWKNYGKDLSTTGPVAGAFRATCIEPLKRWRIQYDGVAARTTREENRTSFLPATAQPEPVEFDLLWDARTPIWSIGGESAEEAEDHSIWHMHLEQSGVVRGHLRWRGETITFSGPGYRDHSMGPRELSKGIGHTWLHAGFPESRRHFGLITLSFADDARRHINSYSVLDGELRDEKTLEFPEWPEGLVLYEPAGFTVTTGAGGNDVTFTGELLDPSFYFTVAAPSEIILGYESGSTEPLWSCREVLCRFDLDGEVGYGFLEISRRHRTVTDPAPA